VVLLGRARQKKHTGGFDFMNKVISPDNQFFEKLVKILKLYDDVARK
jgi:hypothetical protein